MQTIMQIILDQSLEAFEELDHAIAHGHFLGECDELILAKDAEWDQLEYTIDALELALAI